MCTYVALSAVVYKMYKESNAMNIGAVWDAEYSRQRDTVKKAASIYVELSPLFT